MTGTMQRRLYVIFHHLLVLTTNHLVKFNRGSEAFGSVRTHNLDE
jgi:hypothetical protein